MFSNFINHYLIKEKQNFYTLPLFYYSGGSRVHFFGRILQIFEMDEFYIFCLLVQPKISWGGGGVQKCFQLMTQFHMLSRPKIHLKNVSFSSFFSILKGRGNTTPGYATNLLIFQPLILQFSRSWSQVFSSDSALKFNF